MKMIHPFIQAAGCIIFSLLFIVAACTVNSGQELPEFTTDDARAIITESYIRWGNARVEFDSETFDDMLAPDFYVKIDDQEFTRQEFIDMISVQNPGVNFTRFDVTVFTVQQINDEWVAVISEKIEHENAGEKVYGLWITRDGWKKLGDKWVATFSEAIGYEHWRDGEIPPFIDW